jgi:hypothetical protein
LVKDSSEMTTVKAASINESEEVMVKEAEMTTVKTSLEEDSNKPKVKDSDKNEDESTSAAVDVKHTDDNSEETTTAAYKKLVKEDESSEGMEEEMVDSTTVKIGWANSDHLEEDLSEDINIEE